jgi:broad specificity phosphatase PhoE
MKKRLIAYFVRHGDTDLNDKNEFRGDLDVDLNDKGREQAQRLVSLFANRKFSGAYGSSRKRVEQTLHPLLESKGMKMKVLSELDSLDTGDFAGEPKSKKNLDELKWYREHPDEQIPGGETVRNFRNRVDGKVLQVLHKGEDGSKPVLIGAHGSIIKEIGRLLHGDMDHAKVDPGGVVGIYASPAGYSAEALVGERDEPEEVYAGS